MSSQIHHFCEHAKTNIGLGLVLLLLQEVLYTILSSYRDLSGMNILLINNHSAFINRSSSDKCDHTAILANLHAISDPADDTFLLLIGPQILNRLAQLLVNMTALEFICAQSPRTVNGLLIGLWYAMFSIKYLVMSNLDIALQKTQYFFIYQGIRTLAVLLSVIFFSCTSCSYKYRVRDEVVPEQWLVEDVFERRIDQEEEFGGKGKQCWMPAHHQVVVITKKLSN